METSSWQFDAWEAWLMAVLMRLGDGFDSR